MAGSGSSVLQTASFDWLSKPITKPISPPQSKLSRTIYATTGLERSELLLDLCRGPISIDLEIRVPCWSPSTTVAEGSSVSQALDG